MIAIEVDAADIAAQGGIAIAIDGTVEDVSTVDVNRNSDDAARDFVTIQIKRSFRAGKLEADIGRRKRAHIATEAIAGIRHQDLTRGKHHGGPGSGSFVSIAGIAVSGGVGS